MKIFHFKKELSEYLKAIKNEDRSVGLVPTMGALHDGHQSLVEKAMSDNDEVVVSIFVNPTQFNNKEDLIKYPRTLDRDVDFLKNISGNKIIIYAPSPEDVYDGNVASKNFNFKGLDSVMEGAFRPGHFDGVGTVVKRLLEIVKPNKAYFGEKDFQQLAIIKKMVEIHNLPSKIIGCDIYRAEDGLAMSSRNERLKPKYREAAPFIYKTLKSAKQKFGTKSANKVSEWVKKQFKSHPLLELEYFTIADDKTLKPVNRKSNKKNYRAFIAVYAGDVRLIDNIALN
ncbi:pantoate--beta-alanine ligase [Winogradskyella sp. A3E31]|uniref:pantoate--beta-alanine ligase n=1 Tax=Winogradskyella sp. A3E31 TaxID=3349637 RepID=UPI00398B5E01